MKRNKQLSKKEKLIDSLIEASKGNISKAKEILDDRVKISVYFIDDNGNDVETGKPIPTDPDDIVITVN